MSPERNASGWKDTGVFDQGSSGQLPPKEAGKHRWIVATSHTVTEQQAQHGASGTVDVYLDHENRLQIDLGCIDCEQPYLLVKDQPCPAGDEWFQELWSQPSPPQDPTILHAESSPAGSGGQPTQETLKDKVVLMDSCGVSLVMAGQHAEPEDARPFMAISLLGRVNKSQNYVHHLYFADPSMVGLILAQLISMAGALGPEVGEAYDRRVEELKADKQWPE